ncbi:hypothetical protein BWGOE4_56920 [Bacillus mycoides]|uniref:DUF2306 domain-containing protein n=1 Tax=Bacillus mycoides TaxID=1405 RepID=A0A1E8BEU6_BACMY|nr:DUF2306 domain-containing protein [Bacillus mycoides]OFD52209.1 hypothetical protein BWGOE4_56920 [Bacillus mycoides]OFD55581.1 hypothetical protein BWGOE7_56500 [Bacillus mycoides]OFD87018.1 hypothetical protein BWGOE11_57640 [Bacillus mycoides]OFD87093.1 hypothetical protein BWGOE12_57900 [Bacillus mycoides]OFD87617.1 hypothetical protein BWGOE13_56970 [Bacillus mycoides]
MFRVILFIHILVGVICLIAGLAAMVAPKKKGLHKKLGEIYHFSFIIVFITTVAMAIMHWESSSYLLYIGIFSYSLALLGYLAGKFKWKNWVAIHIGSILGSYIAILTAVLVVNVNRMPILNNYNPLIFWLIPTIIGSPIIYLIRRKYESEIK